MTYIVALRTFFGVREGQSTAEFVQEAKMLTSEDKAELRPMLATALDTEVETPK